MTRTKRSAPQIAICHPIDPAGHVPAGTDTFIRGILKWAPDDLDYTLFGASSDVATRPIGRATTVQLGHRSIRYWPLVPMDPNAARSGIPLSVRYMWALRKLLKRGALKSFDVFDFHRIEPVVLMLSDARPKNVVLHQDMSVIRDKDSDILWRYWPQLYESIERRLFARVHKIYSVRQSAVSRYRKLYPNFSDKFCFIPTWVDTTIFVPPSNPTECAAQRRALRRALGARENARIVVAVGRLDQQKDPLRLLETFGQVASDRSDVHLAIVGDGALRSRVETAIAARGLNDRVSLLGVQPAAEIAKLHQLSDVFIMTSAYEGMPIALLEALATGLPVVTTDVGEVRLVVRDRVNGRISADRCVPTLAACLHEVLEELPKLRGEPCVRAVGPYHAATVLRRVYEHHREQSSLFLSRQPVAQEHI